MEGTPIQDARVFVIDDDPLVRDSLISLFESVGIAAESFDSPKAFLKRPLHAGPACLVLDLRMPAMDGLGLQEYLAQSGVAVRVVFLSGRADVPTMVRAMLNGADDFLVKPVDDTAILEAVTRALAVSRASWRRIRDQALVTERLSRLTPRELEVAMLVSAGRLTKQIAGELGISEHTVKVHRVNMMRKLEVESVPQLVRLLDRRNR